MLEGPLHPAADPSKHSNFCNYFRLVRDGETLDSEQLEDFGLARRELFNDTVSRANMVVTTLSNTGDYTLWEHFLPNVIILDEASRALEPDVWNILGNYNAAASFLVIGDDSQLQPVVMSGQKKRASKSGDNSFSRQLKLSYFARCKHLGRPSVLSNVQYRMMEPIGTMMSNLFYSGSLRNAIGTEIAARRHLCTN